MDCASPASTCTIGEEAQGMESNGMDNASPTSTCTIGEEVQEMQIEPSPKALEVFESKATWQGPTNTAEREHLEHLCEADAVLRWEGIQSIGFSYMRLWAEETYHINIDASPLVEVPELYPWNPFLVEKEFHPALHRNDGWFYGPHTLDDATTDTDDYNGAGAGRRIFSTIFRRAKGAQNTTPINILSIPAYLDVLVYQRNHCTTSKPRLASSADWQIERITKNLFLELPHQRDPLLFQVEAETENFLVPYLAKYERKPQFANSKSQGLVSVDVWNPNSYPEDSFPRLEWRAKNLRDQPQAPGSSSTGAAPEQTLASASRSTYDHVGPIRLETRLPNH
ncbi:hypothetical protein V496_03123 [Pseudogymnoascus sp. VKM F-4515 (FW-2607)]|nr:hypothetical protein V496_03123 [Pseudogymnoascus sp. VKM F-4515 (FW-2607)]